MYIELSKFILVFPHNAFIKFSVASPNVPGLVQIGCVRPNIMHDKTEYEWKATLGGELLWFYM
jgi:hypothetical protein